jgi:ribonucleoside-diphosphate reductase alpha chain
MDHPEVEEFISWKMKEERKARALVLGSQALNDGGEIYSDDFEGEAINTVSAQNANNSLRITNKFLDCVDGDHNWQLTARTTGKIVKTVRAKELWNQIVYAAWSCADPGLQFHDTINEWHTCKTDGNINASNPCSEYMFLDNTACNLASLNLGKFLKDSKFQIEDFEYATRIWTIILEISVYMASFPSKEIAENSYAYRTLGLGYMNLGGLLMRKGFGYDSDEGRNLSSAITAIMHGISYLTSQEMAEELGPFLRWEANKDHISNVISMHRQHVYNINCLGEMGILVGEALNIWNKIEHNKPFRNAQVTLQAPTGTIHLVTDCDTSGIEPDFSLIKFKQLAGGGMMKIVNECLPEALDNLGYTPAQIMSMRQHIEEHGNLENYLINGKNLPESHLKVFDCANISGNGKRYLSALSHVKMMAAIQPFLSGAISKTCNLPNHATLEDVDFIYREANRLGLKAIAIYRDGCKMTQPLSSKKEEKKETILGSVFDTAPSLIKAPSFLEQSQTSDRFFSELLTPQRTQLPMRRKGYRQKVQIDGQSVYLSTGEYSDGRLGEIWIEISREGSTVRALLGSFSKAISVGLQYGVPLSKFIDAFVYTKFEPAGIVQGHDRIKTTTSVLDFIFRELAINYLNQIEFANVTQEEPDQEVFLDLDNLKTKPIPIPTEILSSEILAHSKSLNFTGNICPNCGHNTLRQTGTCVTCTTCNSNTGCG